ncbi:hypothetical protein D3Z45_05575 [Lachnospiraceae bacterium]|nr:hypothetical protein [Lachnospiraceae bacterium]
MYHTTHFFVYKQNLNHTGYTKLRLLFLLFIPLHGIMVNVEIEMIYGFGKIHEAPERCMRYQKDAWNTGKIHETLE